MHIHTRIFNCFLVLFLLTSLSINAQEVKSLRLSASERAIPKIVLEAFKLQNPTAISKQWFVTHLSYWQNDYSSDWYNGWYANRTVVVYRYEKPNYYEIEFMIHPGEKSRSIYNLYGYWYETRTQINGLTMAIHDSLRVSIYKDWEISKFKEKIESPMWPDAIYRFNISKGMKSRIIRMDSKGNIIQEKYVQD